MVGVGYLGAIHAKIYHQMPAAELVAVVDTDPARAGKIAAQYGCAALVSAEELVGQGVDAVSVVVPTSAHLAVAEPLLRAGIHMMLEKPIAPDVAQGEAIIALAKTHRAILQIGHLERFNAGLMKLVELVEAPRFIEVHRLSPFVGRGTDVDVVTDLMIHDIDIILSLIPAKLTGVHASGSCVLTPHIDIANVRLEFDSGAVANVTASRVSRQKFRRIRVFAANGYFGLDFASQQLEWVVPNRDAQTDPNAPKLLEQRVEVTPQQPLDTELAHFVSCVRNQNTPLVSGEDGVRALNLAHQVQQKIAKSVQQFGG